MNAFDPLFGLTREQLQEHGIDADQWVAQQNVRHEQEQVREATDLVAAAQQAVFEGRLTNAEAAEVLRQGGNATAWNAFTEMWAAEEGQELEETQTDELAFADATDYLSAIEELHTTERSQLEAELQRAQNAYGSQLIRQLGDRFREFVASTPGAHESSEDVLARLRQLVVDQNGIPTDATGQDLMIAQAVRDVGLREGITAQLTEQVEVEHRAHERNLKDRNFAARRTDDRSQAQREADAAAWKQNRLDELAGQVTQADVEAARELPPSSREISAAQVAKYAERQAKSTSFHEHIAEIGERGRQRATRDRGDSATADRKAYRDALARAEHEAMYGSSAPVVATGYGDTHEETVAAALKPGGYGPDGSWPDELGPAL
jgi:hypothetical protein